MNENSRGTTRIEDAGVMRSAQILTGTYRIFLHSLHVTYAYGYTYCRFQPLQYTSSGVFPSPSPARRRSQSVTPPSCHISQARVSFIAVGICTAVWDGCKYIL